MSRIKTDLAKGLDRIEEAMNGKPDDDPALLCLPAGQLFALKERLAKLTVLGPWEKKQGRWERPEAGQPVAPVTVWYNGDADWSYRVGFGVLGIAGVSSRRPFATAEACMARVDELLAKDELVITA